MPHLIPAHCRRCNRPLRDHLSARAGLGAKCAQYEAAESPQGPQGAVVAPAGGFPASDPASAAVAAVTAALHGLPEEVLDELLGDADKDVTRILAGLMAYAVANTVDGPQWLERLALDWARTGVV